VRWQNEKYEPDYSAAKGDKWSGKQPNLCLKMCTAFYEQYLRAYQIERWQLKNTQKKQETRGVVDAI
jgi:hypothetical protein